VALFLSTIVNKVDRKGRVSVPAPFRAALTGQSFGGIVAFRSFKLDAIECRDMATMEEMSARLDTLEQFSEEYDSLATLFADSQQLAFDGEGRIMLPKNLMDHAGIGETAAFVGLGSTFQIWEPTAFEQHKQALRERARRNGMTLPPRRPANTQATTP
jgi:MraZ protein